MGGGDDRSVVAEMRGDSRLRRAVFYVAAWVGITTLMFLVTLRVGGVSYDFWNLWRAQVALGACALLAAPLAWWAARRQRPDYRELEQHAPRALEVTDLPRVGYRGRLDGEANGPRPESDEPRLSALRPGLRRWLGALALLVAVSGGTVYGHPVAVALLAGACIALSCVALLLGYGVQQALERRRRRTLAPRVEEVRMRIDAEPEVGLEEEDDVSDARAASSQDARRP